jgi:hypothetical protein
MYRYKVTAIGMLVNDWQDLRNAIFGDSPAIFEQYGATPSAEFHFDSPQTPADLGPLIRVELLPND